VFAGVRASTLLTGVPADPLSLSAMGLLAAAATFYLIGTRRVGRRRRWARSRTVAFLGGLVALWVAVGSGVVRYDETSVALHVVQHLLLMMVAPPLLALGRPVVLASQAAPRSVRPTILRALRSRSAGGLTHPGVGAVLYFGLMLAMFADRSMYDYLIGHPLAHAAGHVLVLSSGVLYWHPLLGVDPARRRMSHPMRLLAIMLAMPLEAATGLWLGLSTRPIDPINTLADSRSAGELFLAVAMTVSGVWAVVVMAQWYRQAAREDRRETRRAAAAGWHWTVPVWEQTGHPLSGS
jgi:putative copper resistance protein D